VKAKVPWTKIPRAVARAIQYDVIRFLLGSADEAAQGCEDRTMKLINPLVTACLIALCICGQNDPAQKKRATVPDDDRVGPTGSLKGPMRPKPRVTIHTRNDAENIDLFTANKFHERLSILSKHSGICVSYRGPLDRERGRPGFVPVEADPGRFLEWIVGRNISFTDVAQGIFTFSVSTVKVPDTVAQCVVNGKTLYLQVKDLNEVRKLDDPIPDLAGKEKVTPRSLLEELGKPAPE
jgi:hypothetical protein